LTCRRPRRPAAAWPLCHSTLHLPITIHDEA
jgi:hypothetical protein